MHRRTILLIACVAQFMATLDVTIVNIALPAMRDGLGLDAIGQQWILNVYVLVFGGCLLVGGRAGDVFGRRRMFCAGLLLFSLASLLGGLAQTGTQVVVARGFQGLGAALFVPATMSLITTTFSGHDRTRALAWWSAAATTGGASGVLLGGLLTDLLSWRWVMFVNLPIGLALVAASLRWLPAFRVAGGRRLDAQSAVLVTGGVGALVYAIVETEKHPWGSAPTLGFLALSAVLLALFVLSERRSHDPVVPARMLHNRALLGSITIGALLGGAIVSQIFFMALYLQEVQGLAPIDAALLTIPIPAAAFVGSVGAAPFVRRFGSRRVLIVGPLFGATGHVWWSLLDPGDPYLTAVILPAVLATAGTAVCHVPMTMAATRAVALPDHGVVSGLLNSCRQIGMAISLAILATVAAGRSSALLAEGADRAAALTSGYDRALLLAGVLLALISVVAWVVLPPRPRAAEPEPASAVLEATA